jgi:hypothetical protein
MNWGAKIVTGMILFMLFISVLVGFMIKEHGNDSLVEENYYEKGLKYDEEYQSKQNTITDDAKPGISITEKQILIQLKDNAQYKLVLLRPSDIKADQEFKGQTLSDSNLILIDKSRLGKGLWFLNLEWKSKGRNYVYKQNITL